MLKSPIMIEGLRTLYQELSNKFQMPTRNNHLIEDEIEGRKSSTCDPLTLFVVESKLPIFITMIMKSGGKDYELVRSNLNLHFLWPKHKAPTINTYPLH